MKLNHVNLPVEDVAATKTFFERFFDFKCEEVKGNNMLAVLRNEDDFILVLTSHVFNTEGNHSYPDAFHIGFLKDNAAAVSAVYNRLVDGGVQLDKAPSKMRGGFGFYFYAPGNVLIEISFAAR